MKRTFLMVSVVAILMGMSSFARADLNSFLRDVNRQALSDVKHFNDRLSRQFGIPVPDVERIVRSVPDPADAFMILQLSQMAHVEPALVLNQYQRNKGKSWGRLARELGIKPGSREFHALKRGDLALTGEPGGAVRHGKKPKGDEAGQGRGKGHGNGHGRN